MTTWARKSTAPLAFNFVDAILSLIHGDPVWGWLEGYAHLGPNQYFNTDQFCVAGPANAATLNLADLLNVANPTSPDWFAGEQATALKVQGALHDRLFAAMCEQPGGVVGTYGADVCQVASHAGGGWGNTLIWTVPPGATEMRVKVSDQSGTWDVHCRYDSTGVAGEPVGGAPANVLFQSNSSFTTDYTYHAVLGGEVYCIDSSGHGTGSSTWCVGFNVTSAEPFTPADQPQPDGFTPRTIPPTDAIGDIGPLLAAIEWKLEYLIGQGQGVVGAIAPLPGEITAAADLTPDVPLEVEDAVGCILTASEIPASASLDFGTPQNIVRLANINFGNVDGWFPTIRMTHSPFIVRPFPAGTTKMSVTAVISGATISSRLIGRAH